MHSFVYLFSLLSLFCLVDQSLLIDSQKILTKSYNSENSLFFEVTFPEEISYTFKIRPAQDFGSDLNRTLEAIRLIPVDPNDGCHLFENEIYIRDAVAFIERGSCSFLSKAIQAEKAGAVAAIIYDNSPENENIAIDMVSDDTDRSTNIPAYFLHGKDGKMIVQALNRLRMRDALINIPLNFTAIPSRYLNQPPWTLW